MICRHILRLHGNAQQRGRRGSRLMSRRRSQAEPHVGLWNETMVGREWDALLALCDLDLIFLSQTHTHTHTHTHTVMNPTEVCDNKNRMSEGIYLSRRNLWPSNSCKQTQCRGWVDESLWVLQYVRNEISTVQVLTADALMCPESEGFIFCWCDLWEDKNERQS